MIIVDSSGWIEFFFEKANAYCFAESIEDSGNLLVPVISIYEVFKKILLTTDEARAFQAVVQMKQGRVVELTVEEYSGGAGSGGGGVGSVYGGVGI